MGVRVMLMESHVILACLVVRGQSSRLQHTLHKTRLQGIQSNCEILTASLGGGAKAELLDRWRKLAVILEAWLSAFGGLQTIPFEVNPIVVYKVYSFLSYSWRYRQDLHASGKCAVGLWQFAIELDPCLVVHTVVQCGQQPITPGYFL